MQEDWENALDDLLEKYGGISARQREQILTQVRLAVDEDRPEDLSRLDANSDELAAALLAAMLALGLLASDQVIAEAAAQGVTIAPVEPERSVMESASTAIAVLMASSLAVAAGQEALRVASAVATGAEVAELVATHLDALSDRYPRDQLGGALSQAQHAARMATMEAAKPPPTRYVAVEINDANRCGPCREIDGTEFDTLVAAQIAYPVKGYIACQGGVRCRGQIVAIWDRPKGATSD